MECLEKEETLMKQLNKQPERGTSERPERIPKARLIQGGEGTMEGIRAAEKRSTSGDPDNARDERHGRGRGLEGQRRNPGPGQLEGQSHVTCLSWDSFLSPTSVAG